MTRLFLYGGAGPQGGDVFTPVNGGEPLIIGGGTDPDPDPGPEEPWDADLGVVGNRPALDSPPDATNTGPRYATTQTMSGSQALAAILDAPVEADGRRYLRRTHVTSMVRPNLASHGNIVFEDCVISGGLYAVRLFYSEGDGAPSGAWPEFRFCDISGGSSTAVIGSYGRFLRCNLHHSPINVRPYGNLEFYACYNHSTWHFSGAHCDLWQFFRSSGNVLIHWNNCQGFNSTDSPSAPGQTSSSVLQTGTLNGSVFGVTWRNNWFNGGHYTLRGRKDGDEAHEVNYTFRNNRLGRDFRYGPLQYEGRSNFDFDTSNVWDDTGLPVLG